MACFIFKTLEIKTQDNGAVNLQISLSDIESMRLNMSRFSSACEKLSNNNMTVTYDMYEIDETLTSATYSEEYGYYIDPSDVKNILEKYLKQEEYDHVFIVVRLGNEDKNIEIPVNDWIGLRRNGYKWYRIFKY